LKQTNLGGLEDKLDEHQAAVVGWFDDNHVLWILLVMVLIVLAKGVGLKDPLSLRNMAATIFARKITIGLGDVQFLRFLIAAFIVSLQSSGAKLLEYKTVSHELQLVIGAPVRGVLGLLRWLLRKIKGACSDKPVADDAFEWVHPKWTLEISDRARQDRSMDVMTNFARVTRTWKCCTCRRGMLTALDFLLAVLWTSVIEWVSLVSELFLYAHNWSLSRDTMRNVAIVLLSELVDIDRLVEMWLFAGEYPDLLEAKTTSVWIKPFYWSAGYLIVLPLTLWWAYQYVQQVDGKEELAAQEVHADVEHIRANGWSSVDIAINNSATFRNDEKADAEGRS